MDLRDRGDGRAVLLVPGAPPCIPMFEPIVRALAERRRVLLPRLPGEGGAQHPGSVAAIHGMLVDALAAARIDDLDVVGFSIGAWHAVKLALGRRMRVGRMVLLAPLLGVDEPMRAALAGLAGAIRAGQLDPAAKADELFLTTTFAQGNPEEVRRVRDWVREVPRTAIADDLDAAAGAEDLRSQASALSVPTLIRAGTADRSVSFEAIEALARSIPAARLQIAQGAGHVLPVEDREATVHSTVAWLLGRD